MAQAKLEFTIRLHDSNPGGALLGEELGTMRWDLERKIQDYLNHAIRDGRIDAFWVTQRIER